MPVINLGVIRPGDVRLETANPLVAEMAGQGPYGHAAVAYSRLLWLEAGVGEGVLLEGMRFALYRAGEAEFVGSCVDGQVRLRRLRRRVKAATIWERATTEMGRPYATVATIRRLTDLTELGRRAVRIKGGRLPAADSPFAPGRFCSESVAQVLGLPDANLSPNALSDHSALRDIVGVLSDEEVEFVGEHPRAADVKRLVDKLNQSTIGDFAEVLEGVEVRLRGGEGVDFEEPETWPQDIRDEIEAAGKGYAEKLEKNVCLIRDVKDIEREIFAGPVRR